MPCSSARRTRSETESFALKMVEDPDIMLESDRWRRGMSHRHECSGEQYHIEDIINDKAARMPQGPGQSYSLHGASSSLILGLERLQYCLRRLRRTWCPIARSAWSRRHRLATADDRERLWRRQAGLGPEWSFGLEDSPHFIHQDRRQWLVRDERNRWEAWLGHRRIGQFNRLTRAKAELVRTKRNEACCSDSNKP